jgi:hypothetical protein
LSFHDISAKRPIGWPKQINGLQEVCKMMTAGRMRKFREGWALPIGSFGAAHFYTRDGVGLAVSLCGAMSPAPPGMLHDAGSWTHCKRCEQRRLKAPLMKENEKNGHSH